MPNRRRLLGMLGTGAVSLLAGCGFRLRGSGKATTFPFRTIYLDLPAKSRLAPLLRRYLEVDGNTVVTGSPKTAEVTLVISSETQGKTVLSLSTEGRVRELGLSYTLVYSVTDSTGKQLLAPTQLSANRNLSFNESATLGKEAEEAMIYRDLQNDLAQQMLRRLSSLSLTLPE